MAKNVASERINASRVIQRGAFVVGGFYVSRMRLPPLARLVSYKEDGRPDDDNNLPVWRLDATQRRGYYTESQRFPGITASRRPREIHGEMRQQPLYVVRYTVTPVTSLWCLFDTCCSLILIQRFLLRLIVPLFSTAFV